MFASTIVSRNIIRSNIAKFGISFDKHTYTEKTTPNDPLRRSIVFKVRTTPSEAFKIASSINQEFLSRGFSNSVKVTEQQFQPFYQLSPLTYIRVIAYI